MIRLSERDTEGLRAELLNLRQKRNPLILNLKKLEDDLTNAQTEEEYDRLTADVKSAQEDLASVLRRIKELEEVEDKDPSRAKRRKREEAEIEEHGFTMVDHGDTQYNKRYNPRLNREQLFKILKDSGLAEKIPDETHHIIKIMDNFFVAVEDHKVLTFKYEPSYYYKHNRKPPKYTLPIEVGK